jgi:hypothetical protein
MPLTICCDPPLPSPLLLQNWQREYQIRGEPEMRLDPESEAEEMLKRHDPPQLLALFQVQLSAI